MTDQRVQTAPSSEYRYPGAGDPRPPGCAHVLLLTDTGVCIRGPWEDSPHLLAWAPFPKRDREKEARLKAALRGARP